MLCRGKICGSLKSLTVTLMPGDKLLPAKSILLLCPAEVTDERAGLRRWLLQISLLKVNLPVGYSDLECVGNCDRCITATC